MRARGPRRSVVSRCSLLRGTGCETVGSAVLGRQKGCQPTSAVDHAMPHTSTRLRFNLDLPLGFVIDPEACPT